jgi:hypothetical protein
MQCLLLSELILRGLTQLLNIAAAQPSKVCTGQQMSPTSIPKASETSTSREYCQPLRLVTKGSMHPILECGFRMQHVKEASDYYTSIKLHIHCRCTVLLVQYATQGACMYS